MLAAQIVAGTVAVRVGVVVVGVAIVGLIIAVCWDFDTYR